MRIHYLDSLRGIAALMVVIYHANCWLDFMKDKLVQSTVPNHILNIFFSGNAAVALFFVLSGFVLSLKYIAQQEEKTNKLHLIEFFIKRIFRLYPAFWTVLLLVYLCFGGNVTHFLQESTLLLPQNAAVHKVPIDWTLIIEAKMSILMPIFILLAYYNYRYVLFFAFVLLTLLDTGSYVIHFSIGILIAKYFHYLTPQNWQQSKFYPYRYAIYFLTFVLMSADQFYFIAIRQIDLHTSYTYWGFIAKGVASGIIIALVICSPKAQKFLENPILLFLGSISYGIYIGHWLICVDIIETLYFEKLQSMIGSYYLSHIIIRYGVWTIASILIGTILYYGIEKPAIKLGSKLIAQLRKTSYWQYF